MKYLTDENFDEEVKADFSVIDFYADWCGPCQMMGPVFEELSGEMEEVNFLKLDTEKYSELASKFGIRGIPTLVFLKKGKEAGRITGFVPKEAIREKIEECM